jgi:hypothetical protein
MIICTASKTHVGYRKFIAGFLACFAMSSMVSAQTWTPLTNQPNFYPGVAMLLTDGTVMVQSFATNGWWRLTADDAGSYINGTWSPMASMPANYAPYAYASAVLPDGHAVVIGGEYNFATGGGISDTSMGEIYDPQIDSWASLPDPSDLVGSVGDAPSVVLANGTFMLGNGIDSGSHPVLLSASTLTWTATGNQPPYGNSFSEQGFTLLPTGQVLTINVADVGIPNGNYNSEIYNPETENWFSAGSTLVPIASRHPCSEIGPAVLRPDGTVFAIGATSNTAIYHVADGAWSQGPTFPDGLGVADGPAALLPSGNVLVQASPASTVCFAPGSQFFEFDGQTLNPVPGPPGAENVASNSGLMLVLPTGQIFYTGVGGGQIYTPSGTYKSSWAPTIGAFPSSVSTGGSNYSISGTQFNGLSQGAMYGDDAQMATNYPLVRITNNTTGHVFYARTHDHSSMGVATGAAIVSTKFDVPQTIETGASTLSVVANGIPSEPVNVDVVGTPGFDLDQHGLTGSWYNPATGGQGFEIEVYPDVNGPGQGLLFAGWFTYDVTAAGGRRWYGLTGNVSNTNPTGTLQIFAVEGGNLNAPPSVGANGALGQATIQFSDCNTGSLIYNFTDGSGRSGTIPLARLTPNVTCSPSGDNGNAASDYLLSGNWFNPNTSGQGLIFDFSPSINNVFAAWYTFAQNGQQIGGPASQSWFTLQSNQFVPRTTSLDNIPIIETTGGIFDKPTPTTSAQVGVAKIAFTSCNAMTLNYSFTAGENMGIVGTINLQRVGPTPLGCTL